jgi:hypothetical protein
MIRMLIPAVVTIYCLIILTGCSSGAKLYLSDNSEKIYSGTLSDSTNITLRKFLTTRSGSSPKDTIIIKYDYDNESCWDRLDQQDTKYIQRAVTSHQQRIQALQARRPDVSFFDFREPGKHLNKLKKWDSSIIIDSSRQLLNLLFKDRSECGSSIIVLPTKRFVFVRSDSHSEAMDMTKDNIVEYLANYKTDTRF